MPLHNFEKLQGRIDQFTIDSQAISNNVLGDPSQRDVLVYLPPGYDEEPTKYPVMVDIAGFTGSGHGHVGWKAFGESVPQRVERLIACGDMGKTIVVFPDCFTSMGGNQYINSSALGNWADFLIHEMLPEVDRRYRTLVGPAHRGLFGKSSGGYGSMYHGMAYADHWGAVACHSGDMFFDLVYRSDFPDTLMHLAGYESIDAFMKMLNKSKKISGDAMHTLMILAMAATYDPDPSQPYGVRLPVDLNTCELDLTAWKRWLKSDPVEMIERADVQANLSKLKGIYIDCGSRDQYALVFGARKLQSRLEDLGIKHFFEEFPDNHSSVDYRMDVSLPYLYQSLMGD